MEINSIKSSVRELINESAINMLRQDGEITAENFIIAAINFAARCDFVGGFARYLQNEEDGFNWALWVIRRSAFGKRHNCESKMAKTSQPEL
jgi:hypothetical protein